MPTSTVMENPLRQGIRLEQTAEPCTVIIFGASGDLTKRKLVPALYRLVQERLVPAEFAIVGLARTEMGDDDYQKLGALLDRVDGERGTAGNRLFYLSVAPRFYAAAVEQLGRAGLAKAKAGSWVRVIIEKPFGTDLESARLLNKQIHEHLDESQIYRIDHYLGKETVQNLLAFRFANGIFEPLWNRQYIDHVQITNAEAVGVE